MTGKELSKLFYLNREIEQDRIRLLELESVATGSTAYITGMPHATFMTDKTALAAEIADIRNGIEAKIMLSVTEYNRLMRFIATVDDSLMRQILTFRHINGFDWRQVATHIGGGNTEAGVRQAHSRYLRKISSQMSQRSVVKC